MGLQKIGFEGQTAGATITTANSDDFGDSILASAVTSGGATITYASDWAAHGTRSAKISNGVSGSSAIFAYTFAANPSCAQRVYFRFDALPSVAATTIMQYRHSPDSSANGIAVNSVGQITGSSAETGASKFQSSYVLQPNTDYRLESGQTLAGAGAGRFWMKLFLGEATTPITGAFYDSGNTLTNNTIQPNLSAGRIGKLTTTAVTSNFWFDDWAVVDGSIAEIGPVSSFSSNVRLGSSLSNAAYVGGTAVSRMYLGTTQIFG